MKWSPIVLLVLSETMQARRLPVQKTDSYPEQQAIAPEEQESGEEEASVAEEPPNEEH